MYIYVYVYISICIYVYMYINTIRVLVLTCYSLGISKVRSSVSFGLSSDTSDQKNARVVECLLQWL